MNRRSLRPRRFFIALAGWLVCGAPSVGARTLEAPAVSGAAVAALQAAADGDTVQLAAGQHRGPLLVKRRIVLRGGPGAVVSGGGESSVVTVSASGASIEDLAIEASGRRVITIDAGLRILSATGVLIRRVRLTNVLYGIYAERADGLEVERCVLTGRVPAGREDGEGNGIHLWYTRGSMLRDNDVSHFQDAIYLSFAGETVAEGNHLHANGRYGFHTMYCQAGRLTANTFERNVAGCAIMFSNHLDIRGNRFLHNRGPRTYGLLLRDCSDGVFEQNALIDNTIGMFLDDSNRNRFTDNLLQDNGWGVLMFSSCAGNVFSKNAFLNDDYSVALDMKYTSNRFDDGRTGNYWSENAPYDLDADGVSDAPYSPVGTFAFLSKQYPDLSVLAKSPAVAALAVAEQVLPALRPSEAVDRHPLVTPPPLATRGPARERTPARAPWGAAAFGALTLVSLGGLRARWAAR